MTFSRSIRAFRPCHPRKGRGPCRSRHPSSPPAHPSPHLWGSGGGVAASRDTGTSSGRHSGDFVAASRDRSSLLVGRHEDGRRGRSPLAEPHGTAQPSSISFGGRRGSAKPRLDGSSRSPGRPGDGRKARSYNLQRPHEVDGPFSILFLQEARPGFMGSGCRFADSHPAGVGLATQCRRSGRAERGGSLPPGANNLLSTSC